MNNTWSVGQHCDAWLPHVFCTNRGCQICNIHRLTGHSDKNGAEIFMGMIAGRLAVTTSLLPMMSVMTWCHNRPVW